MTMHIKTCMLPTIQIVSWAPNRSHALHEPTATPVTELLVRWRSGDGDALQALMPLVYDEMRRLAHRYLRRERPGHTVQATALVHEAYLRLAGGLVTLKKCGA